MHLLTQVDVFPKYDDHFERDARERTVTGAIITIFVVVAALFIIIAEFWKFNQISLEHTLEIDKGQSLEKDGAQATLNVYVDITFVKIPCALLSVDASDIFGQENLLIERDMVWTRVELGTGRHLETVLESDWHQLSGMGATVLEECPSCYDAAIKPSEDYQQMCCKTCQELREAYHQAGLTFSVRDTRFNQCIRERFMLQVEKAGHEGCNLAGNVRVRKVNGFLYFFAGMRFSNTSHLVDMSDVSFHNLQFAHTIHRLDFGERVPDMKRPLEHLAAAAISDNSLSIPLPMLVNNGSDATNVFDAISTNQQKVTLDSKEWNIQRAGLFRYNLDILETTFEPLGSSRYVLTSSSSASTTEQYTASRIYLNSAQYLPGVVVSYSMSPIHVRIMETRPYGSIINLLLELCAIISGIFMLGGVMDKIFHRLIRVFYILVKK